MIPPLIVREALEKHIDIIAITDHNTTANVEAVMNAAQDTGLIVLPGMELQTLEEVHSLCIFPDLERAHEFQQIVDKALPNIANSPDFFGEQFVVDETGDFIRREERLLIISAELSISKAWELVTSLGGMFIPAHVNRKVFGLIENLGFVPQDIPLQVLEISRHLNSHQAATILPQLSGYTLIKGGDVHRLDEFLGANLFEIENPSFKALDAVFLQKNSPNLVIDD
jgi:PHP family Zn ribbon phosphoesterase